MQSDHVKYFSQAHMQLQLSLRSGPRQEGGTGSERESIGGEHRGSKAQPSPHQGVYSQCSSENSEHLTVLEENVEKDDADLVRHCDVGVQQDGNNQPHWILDLFPLSIYAHSQVLGRGRKNRGQETMNLKYSRNIRQEVIRARC